MRSPIAPHRGTLSAARERAREPPAAGSLWCLKDHRLKDHRPIVFRPDIPIRPGVSSTIFLLRSRRPVARIPCTGIDIRTI